MAIHSPVFLCPGAAADGGAKIGSGWDDATQVRRRPRVGR